MLYYKVKIIFIGRNWDFFRRFFAEVEQWFLKTFNVDLFAKLVVFFALRAVFPQTDVLVGKPLDFIASQSSLDLPIESMSLISKTFFPYMRLIFALFILSICLSMWSFDYLIFLNNSSWTLMFSAISSSNYSY